MPAKASCAAFTPPMSVQQAVGTGAFFKLIETRQKADSQSGTRTEAGFVIPLARLGIAGGISIRSTWHGPPIWQVR